ncbi:hypothetical protein BIFCAT_00177 [Bifidobacterium catenulatum DSM 16992 = JCM 1194 = LMG 11043]|uniref:Uncharacterized protein n=1 Tax=Bifidobacterium catenulatum DSM 16992 = JCM 1194 = LMG 11043 TaxID=566552 RepID=B6XSM2_9BIFI|nr:hypothetical protein BIFCAT_00177 [Bifidobacterium catenulatum DSM 16992 = JCM 1194 = LMG 11043]
MLFLNFDNHFHDCFIFLRFRFRRRFHDFARFSYLSYVVCFRFVRTVPFGSAFDARYKKYG